MKTFANEEVPKLWLLLRKEVEKEQPCKFDMATSDHSTPSAECSVLIFVSGKTD